MCLAVPGKVLEIHANIEPVMAVVDFGGIRKKVCIELVPEVKIGDYVVVHVGICNQYRGRRGCDGDAETFRGNGGKIRG